MKVKLTAYVPYEKEVEMTPEEFCNFRSGKTWNNFFPENSISQVVSLDEKGKNELNDFFLLRNRG